MLLLTFSALTVLIAMFCYSGFAQLQLNPNPLRLSNGATSGSLQISCGIPSGVTASTVFVITVSRYLKSQPETEQSLAGADIAVNGGQAALDATSGLTQNTATVSGSTSQKSMTLTLTQAKCEDAVSPGNITITADPQNEDGNYLLGDILSLECNGVVGTYDPTIGLTWQWSWQYQDYESYSWTLYPNDNDISMEPPFRGTSSCQYHQITRLTRHLTLEDSQRTYRCIVQATYNEGFSDAVYTLGIVADIGDFAQLQLNPNPLQLTNGTTGGSVNISCGIPSGVTVLSIYAITVLRYFKSQPATEQTLARADATVNKGQAFLIANSGVTQNTATVSGSTSQRSMTLTLTQAKCEDAGTYVCKISYNAATYGNTLIHDIVANENLTVTVLFGDISISISPDHPSYNVGDNVTISCNATIGRNNTGQLWSWEYRDETGWHPYPEEDIIIDDPVSGAGFCQFYRQTCYLSRVISMEDNGRHYRCAVKRDNVTAATKTIQMKEVEDHTTSATTTLKTVTTTKAESKPDQVSSACGLANVLISFITSVSLAVMMSSEI